MRSFRHDEGGNVTMVFGLTLLPIFLLVGAAVDYNRAIGFREYARSAADAAALAVANAETPDGGQPVLDAAKARIEAKFGTAAKDVAVTGSWDSTNSLYSVQVSGKLQAWVLPAVPGLNQQNLPVSMEIKVERIPPEYVTEAPTMAKLSPDAADYNRLYMYCYNSTKNTRGEMVAIADNGTPGKDYSKNKLPVCGTGEFVSYKLRNVRNARSDSSKWDDVNQDIYEYYTDTTIDRNTKKMTNKINGGKINRSGTVTTPEDLAKKPILETILCDSLSKCTAKSKGGVLPEDNPPSHTPAVATGGCATGKYMYWGWEDRPGGDQDYNDIRVITSCPKETPKTDKKVHIVE